MRRPGRHGGQGEHYRDYLAGARRHARRAMGSPSLSDAEVALVRALAAAIVVITMALFIIFTRW